MDAALPSGTVRPLLTLAPLTAALLALLAGAWLAVAAWTSLRAARREAAAREVVEDNVRLAALLEAGPAMPLLVDADGTISGPERLAGALGLDALPPRWLALFGDEAPFPTEAAAELGQLVSEAASGARPSRTLRPSGSARIFRIDGGPAPAGFAERSALLWFLDVTAAEEDAARLGAQLQRRSEAFEALSGLIEAAPFPMWHRGPDLKLVMVNGAYVARGRRQRRRRGGRPGDRADRRGGRPQPARRRGPGPRPAAGLLPHRAGDRRRRAADDAGRRDPARRRAGSPAMRSTSRTASRRAPSSTASSAPSATCSTGSRPASRNSGATAA